MRGKTRRNDVDRARIWCNCGQAIKNGAAAAGSQGASRRSRQPVY
jgi:hypothetical protein